MLVEVDVEVLGDVVVLVEVLVMVFVCEGEGVRVSALALGFLG